MRRWLITALAVGVVAGVVIATGVPHSSAARIRADALTPLPGKMTIAKARPPLPATLAFRVHPGTLRNDLTMKDPSGGPVWRIRSYIADRIVRKGDRPPGVNPVIGTSLVAQLGRVVNGRFGWIDAANVFRPAGFDETDVPSLVGSKILDVRRLPDLDARTLITDPLGPNPQIRGTVIWGLVGSRVDGVAVHVARRTEHPRRSPRGAFLVFTGPQTHRDDVRITVTYPGGDHRDKTFGDGDHGGLPPTTSRPRPVPGTTQIEARAPDPGGGPAWGVLTAKGSRGGWCYSYAGQIVGDRLGQIDGRIGSLYEDTGTSLGEQCSDPRYLLTLKRPFVYGSEGGSGLTEGEVDLGRPLLRTLPGRFALYGMTLPSVKLITISTPRDVRTIAPSPRAHAFVTVYDGSFASGKITITATFADGSRVTQSQPAGM
jgi:hypothetical protein